MSTVLEHSANASATIEYNGKYKYGKVPAWVRERQLENYYNSMAEFYTECLENLELPNQFDKKKLIEQLMGNLRTFIRKDEDFTSVVIRIMDNFPRFPITTKQASEYIIALKILGERVARAGLKSNQELAVEALMSKAPFSIYSNLCLGNYTFSYFHEYKANVTEQYFKHSHLLVSGRTFLKARKLALDNYFQMIEPNENLFKILLRTHFRLWLYLTLPNFAKAEDFPKNSQPQPTYELNQETLDKLKDEYDTVLEELRRQLYNAEPELFNPISNPNKPTQTMWKDMVLLRSSQ